MHQVFFVTFNKENAENSQEAREYVARYLMDNSFCYQEGGRWSGAIADWFVIGGRWSGFLNKLTEKFYKEVKLKFPQESQFGYSTKFIEDNAEVLQEIWVESFGGKDKNPINRDSYANFGYEDDAQILTKRLYKIVKKVLDDDKKEGFTSLEYRYADEEYEEFSEDMIGNKWLVVCDYHS